MKHVLSCLRTSTWEAGVAARVHSISSISDKGPVPWFWERRGGYLPSLLLGQRQEVLHVFHVKLQLWVAKSRPCPHQLLPMSLNRE